MVRFSTLACVLATVSWSLDPVGATSRPRRVLQADDNIGEKIKEEHSNGLHQPAFHIKAVVESGGEDNEIEDLGIDVVELQPAVTIDTVVEMYDDSGPALGVGKTASKVQTVSQALGDDESLSTILVTDPESTDIDQGTFAVLAVDLKNDEMRGFVEKKGNGDNKAFQLKQARETKGGITSAQEESNGAGRFVPPDWECGAQEQEGDSEGDVMAENETEASFFERRRLHHHNHHNEHDHSYDHMQDDSAPLLESLSRQLRGTGVINHIGKRRLQTSPTGTTGNYTYQVNLFIEIDHYFIRKTGRSIQSALNYVNILVTAANLVYEKEIDTHLHVSKVIISRLYDGASSHGHALQLMKKYYGKSTWEEGHGADAEGIDLHHAMLTNPLGGGMAFVGAVCSSFIGYAVSAGFSGSYNELTRAMVWDLKMFMHELGHNFGSSHTHSGYSPKIDDCAKNCPGGSGSGWATIMSYCNSCPGGTSNVLASFGGIYKNNGLPKTDIDNWIDNPELVANYVGDRRSVDPRRESFRMFTHVYNKHSKNGCLAIPSPTPSPTPTPTSSPKPTVPQLPVQIASYDATLGVPKCSTIGGGCDSGSELLQGRGNILDRKGEGNGEPNLPNTLDNCMDDTKGSYLDDESVERIKIVSLNGGALTPGTEVEIEATVFAWDYHQDTIDFWHTADASNPSWTLIQSVRPGVSDVMKTIRARFTLPEGGLQAVRVVIRFLGSPASPCPHSGYDDKDDLAFVVDESDPENPPMSTSMIPPTVECPVDVCLERCTGRYGFTISVSGEAYFCAKGCAAMSAGAVTDESKYCAITDPVERQEFCVSECASASGYEDNVERCLYGCEFWGSQDLFTSCNIDGCLANCSRRYGKNRLGETTKSFTYCAKGCAGMRAGGVLDKFKYCSISDPGVRYQTCKDDCDGSSSYLSNREKCKFGCEYWNEDAPPVTAPPTPTPTTALTSTPSSAPTSDCPLEDCLAHCTSHFGGYVVDKGDAYFCAKGCAGMSSGQVVDGFKYCSVSDPVARYDFCIDECSYASSHEVNQEYCVYGCDFWQIISQPPETPVPSKVPSFAPTAACPLDDCLARCTSLYGGNVSDQGDAYFCAKGCAGMSSGQVVDELKYCSIDDPIERHVFCVEECAQASSIEENRNHCVNGCEFWKNLQPTTPSPSKVPSSAPTAACPLDDCLARCTSHYGGSVSDQGDAYFCAKGCAGMSSGQVVDEVKYCSINDPVERHVFCVEECAQASSFEANRNHCVYGCEYWEHLIPMTPSPSKVPSSPPTAACPLDDCLARCTSHYGGNMSDQGDAYFCAKGCAGMSSGQVVDEVKYCSINDPIVRHVFCVEECAQASSFEANRNHCVYGCDFWNV